MNYYNENDPFCCQWLRNLINAGLIPKGDVDERSIQEVQATDLKGYIQCHFFTGIAGWPLALSLAGWPSDREIFTGSCPCQPFSVAGKRKGTADARHLWPDFHRLISASRPSVVMGEQVSGTDGYAWVIGVGSDMEREGYRFRKVDIPACGIGAPHRRNRLYWVANNNNKGLEGSEVLSERKGQCVVGEGGVDGGVANTGRKRISGRREARDLAGATRDTQEEVLGKEGWHDSIWKREWVRSSFDDGGTDGRLAAPNGRIIGNERVQRSGKHGQQQEDGGAGKRLDHTTEQGLEIRAGGTLHPSKACCESERPSHTGFWGAYDTIPCSDGRSRRVEPGTFPLAHGVPSRVGRLRAYGNAIVPELAAEVIAAYLDAEGAGGEQD